MPKFDVVIIGAGLGGLECGYTLAKKGLNVCILEKNPVLGGCLQTFSRQGTTFDTGFHYIGGLDDGQPLNRLFSYFGLMNLPWHKLDTDNFDEVIIRGESYKFANGHDNFAATLADRFPKCKSELKKYTDLLKKVGENIFESFKPKDNNVFFAESLFAKSAFGFLNETFSDKKLLDVISGTSLKMELNKERLPLYTFAQINNSFIESAWRIKGGGDQISDSLAKNIEQMGGTIIKKAEVTELIEKDSKIVSAKLSNGEKIAANFFISNIHPDATLNLVKESQTLRKIYRNRINRLPNTYGMFTANIALKEQKVFYKNRNIYIYKKEDVWSVSENLNKDCSDCVLISFQVPENGDKFCKNIDILTPMSWADVSEWDNTKIGKRGEEYKTFKENKTKQCIEIASEALPELKDSIDKVYTSTPLTYRDYTGTKEGSAYGLQKDCNNLLTTLLSPKTPIKNLFLTGQSLNLHGILGVSMSSFFTCAEIIGIESVTNDLNIK